MTCYTVIVGASSGVGLATARKFASRGDRLGRGKALSVELAPRRVNVLMCGVLNTTIHGDDRSALRAWAEQSLPARRLGEPEDAADYIFALANNPYATGDVATLDGGLALI